MHNSKENVWKCNNCDPAMQFDSQDALSSHNRNHHCQEFKVAFTTKEGETQEVTVKKLKNGFQCPLCLVELQTRSGITKHVKNMKGTCADVGKTEDEDESDESDGDVYKSDDSSDGEAYDAIINVTISLENENIDPNPPSPMKRTYEEAILSALDMDQEDQHTKKHALSCVDFLKLRPLQVTEDDVALCNKRSLTNITNVNKFEDLKITEITKEEDPIVVSNCPASQPLFQRVLLKSPYENIFKNRKYVELNDYFSTLLNTDWMQNAQSKYVAAQLLAGSIIINPKDNQAVLINTVEVYGRTKSVDVHRERFGSVKGKPVPTTLPPENTVYPNIIVKIHHDREGSKLIVGSQTLNALVTSCIRMDKRVEPCVGALVNSFNLCQSDEKNVRIFLDEKAKDKAVKLLGSSQNCLESFHLAYQLRQLRSKFNRKSTYYLVRCNCPMLLSHKYYPFTTFTICDNDSNTDSDASRVSTFFKGIAMTAISDNNPTIEKQTVVGLLKSCKGKKVVNLTKDLIELFPKTGGNKGKLQIFGNSDLDQILKKLADNLSGDISNGNKKVALAILDVFSQ